MIFKTLLESSNFISLLKRFYTKFYAIEKWLYIIYKESKIKNLLYRLYRRLNIYFKYSFLNKIINLEEKNASIVLDNSKFIRGLFNKYRIWKPKIMRLLKASEVIDSVKNIKKELYFLPIKIVSVILTTAILVNIFLSLGFNKNIGMYGWIFRLMLLFVGLSSFYSGTDFKTIKETSSILRSINKYCKL